jgi:hypothetical protein
MYDKKITSNEPTLLILLLDQSVSMSETMTETEQGEVFSIAKIAKIISDTFLYTAFRKCVRGDEFKPYIDLAVIGYGNSINSALPKIPLEQFPFSVKKLADTYIAKNDSNPDDDSAIPKPKLEWVEERADGEPTGWVRHILMLAAFTKARDIVEKWVPDHQTSFPPVIINISDGMPTDDHDDIVASLSSAKQLIDLSRAICKIDTEDGKCLICNCQISSRGMTQILYPSSTAQAEEIDPFAKLMFEMSSIIPEQIRIDANQLEIKLEPNARFFIFNAEIEGLWKLFYPIHS